MSLLTKKERENLDREDRQTLRKERRAARKSDPNRPQLILNSEKLTEVATELIKDMAGEVIPGEDKLMEVLDELASQADDFFEWQGLGIAGTILELIDGQLLKAIIHSFMKPQVQELYVKLRDEGVLEA